MPSEAPRAASDIRIFTAYLLSAEMEIRPSSAFRQFRFRRAVMRNFDAPDVRRITAAAHTTWHVGASAGARMRQRRNPPDTSVCDGKTSSQAGEAGGGTFEISVYGRPI